MLPFLLEGCFNFIHGDAYIGPENIRRQELEEDLKKSPDFVFDHVSAYKWCREIGHLPNVLVVFKPTQEQVLSRRAPEDIDPRTTSYEKALISADAQIGRAKTRNVHIIEGGGIKDILPKLIDFLWDKDVLHRRAFSVIVKVAAHCNLGCDYCYMYKKHDNTSPLVPKTLSPEIAKQLGFRIGEYLEATKYKSTHVIFHGGEPLLLGVNQLRELHGQIKSGAGAHAEKITFAVQTNGTLLNDEMLQALDELGFQVGISIDGPEEADNHHRKLHSGRSARSQILAGIKKAQEYPWKKGKFSGLLTVINPENSGRKTYEGFAAMGIKKFDFLLQDATWDNPPEKNSYDFLKEAFDAWLADTEERKVRIFDALIGGMMADYQGSDAFGLRPPATVCIGTDGQYERLDVLRSSYKDAWKLPYTLMDTDIQSVLLSKESKQTWLDKYTFADECLSSRYFFVVGGGYLPHRYSSKNGFCNPSVHHADINKFMEYAEKRVKEEFKSAPVEGK